MKVTIPSTVAIYKPPVTQKARKVSLNEQNMFALVDEIYDMSGKSFYDSRLIQVASQPDVH